MTLTALNDPFPHSITTAAVEANLAEATLCWMESSAPWDLRIADFYEQWELHLELGAVPTVVSELLNPAFVETLKAQMFGKIVDEELQLIEVTAHKLLSGQTIRVHNDFIENAETHRILLQLNRGWHDSQGGMLMLFGSANSADIRRIIRPLHRSAFGFSISPHSFHAVSKIASGERYTVVYSFKVSKPASRDKPNF